MRYEVIYFPVRGRAETVRLTLALTGQPFGERLVGADWMEKKKTMPLGQVPVLVEIDGETERLIPQTPAILRHLARTHGLYGATPEDALRCDIAYETAMDVGAGLGPLLAPGTRGKDPAALAKYFADTAPVGLRRLEKLLSEGPGAFFATGAPTYADAVVFNVLDIHRTISPGCLDAFPGLSGFVARMEAHPPLAAYLSTRRPSEAAPLAEVLRTGTPL